MTDRSSRWPEIVAGMGLGAGLMYLLDPVMGDRRRGIVRDKAHSALRQSTDALGVAARDLVNRAWGLGAELRWRLRTEEVTPEQLAGRVRAKLGRHVSNPRAIETHVEPDGRVILAGPVLAGEVDQLLAAVASVRGVCEVDNQLDVFDRPEDVPSLQGTPVPRPATSVWTRTNWPPALRLLAIGAGAAAVVNGLRRPSPLGAVLGGAGLALAIRAATNIDFKRLLGMAGRRSVDFQKTINIDAPVGEVFNLFAQYEHFPLFMSNVREARDLGDLRSHWTVSGPLGVPIEWNAVVTEVVPNEVLAWKTEPDAPVAHAGVIRFSENPDGTTRVEVRMTYSPPAGAAGHAVASLFRADPKQQLDEDLMRMKSFVETGVLPHDAAALRG